MRERRYSKVGKSRTLAKPAPLAQTLAIAAAALMINVGYGKTMLARQNVDGPPKWHNRRIFRQDAQKAVQQSRSERRGEAYASVR
jgi:hypothetical protein